MVTWQSDGSSGNDASNRSIQSQQYDASGGKIGAEFQVNIYTPDSQDHASVAVDAYGDYVVTWQSSESAGSDTSSSSIQARVPEPSEFWMLATGIAFLAAVGRRRIKA
jgi:hypothetical protein